MGFLDKAKKLAEQAQTKLDEVQKEFNERQSGPAGDGPAVEYDKHGRPVPTPPAEAASPPHGDPVAPAPPGPPAPPAASAPPAPPAGDADYTPPKMTSGDPLA